MTNSCASIDAVVEETASGGRLGPDMAAHLDGCAACQARLALARRIDRVLADWPVAVPPPHFAAQVASRVRQDAWRHEVVVDWGFNIALAASLVFIVAGAGSFLWLLGAVADPAEVSRLAAGQLESLVGRLRGQAPVVITATVLLATTVVAVWWAGERQRW
ncbi:MAG: hypothetical protein KA371_18665 [Acidobacteria bacterium]|jgi:hypothetical protein|nr:hypothetical protein [Acidobacteriota bacterium]